MARKSAKRKELLQFWLLMGTVAALCLVVIGFYANYDPTDNNRHYARPFSERANGYQKQNGQSRSEGLHVPGLHESDLAKRKGRRYETY